MTALIPVWLFDVALWSSVGGVGAAAAYLLTMLVKDWRAKQIW